MDKNEIKSQDIKNFTNNTDWMAGWDNVNLELYIRILNVKYQQEQEKYSK